MFQRKQGYIAMYTCRYILNYSYSILIKSHQQASGLFSISIITLELENITPWENFTLNAGDLWLSTGLHIYVLIFDVTCLPRYFLMCLIQEY